jgi:uncharacterized protein YkwD
MKRITLAQRLKLPLTLLLILGSIMLARQLPLAVWAERFTTLLQPGRLVQIIPRPSPLLPAPTVAEVYAALIEIRREQELPEMAENVTLQKLTRLLALEIEDSGELRSPDTTSDLLKTLTPNPPRRIETKLWFVPDGAAIDMKEQLGSASAVLDKQIRSFGAATRSAQLSGQKGTILVVALSTPFSSTVASPPPRPPGAQRATFTGQDLWTAVQNYRSAHQLPLFAMSTELCTVASIRVNQLLELGKLDNHAGFQPLSDEFFKEHSGWTAINENIAAGYQSAVQTVEWGWDQSLGHQALIQSREFPKACAAANSGFSVLVTGR